MRIRDWSSDVCSSDLDAEAVAGGVADLDLAGPRLLVDVDAELSRDRVDVVDVEVGEGTRRSVAGVLGEVQMHLAAAQEQVERQVRLEAVLTDLREPQPLVPGRRGASIPHPDDRPQLFGPPRKLLHESAALLRPRRRARSTLSELCLWTGGWWSRGTPA